MDKKPNIFIRILVPFCIGIGILHGTDFAKLNLLLQISTVSLFILLLIFNYLYRPLKVYHHKLLIGYLINLFLFAAGGLYSWRDDVLANSDHFSKLPGEYLKIYTAEEPQQGSSVLRFRAAVIAAYQGKKRSRSTGILMVSIRSKRQQPLVLHYGETFLIPARYQWVQAPQNPGEFDFKTWLARQNIYHQTYLSPEELAPTGEHKGSPLVSYALTLRKRQIDQYRKLIKDDEAFAVASTLILGYRADLDAQTLSAYSKTGTIHALSVSGMHVGIVYAALELALQWMNRKTLLRWIKVVLVLCLIWFYTLVTGYSASVLRSSIMLSLFILGKAVGKHNVGYHVLAFSAFCLLLYNPFLLWDVGFQLSYLSVFGLIYLYPKIYRQVTFKWLPIQKIWQATSISLAAQAATFPISIYYFHQFPVYFLLSNLFITYPVDILMYGGLAILLFRLYWLGRPFEWLITFINNGLDKIAQLPYSTINQIWLTKAELILLLLSLVFLFAGFSMKRKQLLFISMALLICLQGSLDKDKISAARQRKIIVFTLHKKHAIAFIHATKAIIVTDLSPAGKDFKFHVQPALGQRKIKTMIFIPWRKKP